MIALALPAVAVTLAGAPGVLAGVIGPALACGPVKSPLSAASWNEYAVPLVRPVTVIEVAEGDTSCAATDGAPVSL